LTPRSATAQIVELLEGIPFTPDTAGVFVPATDFFVIDARLRRNALLAEALAAADSLAARYRDRAASYVELSDGQAALIVKLREIADDAVDASSPGLLAQITDTGTLVVAVVVLSVALAGGQ